MCFESSDRVNRHAVAGGYELVSELLSPSMLVENEWGEEPVGDWLNCWCLVSVEVFNDFGKFYQRVWAYGEFIGIGAEAPTADRTVAEYITPARPRG